MEKIRGFKLKNRQGIKIVILLFVFLAAGFFLNFDKNEAAKILEKVDENLHFKSAHYMGKITLKRPKISLVKTFESWAKSEDFFIAFTNPEDLGVKYLKKEGDLYVYFPDADDYVLISKSMMKQGFMGSDISYDDITTNRKLLDDYEIEDFRTIEKNGVKYYKIALKAKTKNVAYYRQEILIDAEKYVSVQTDMFDLSNRLIKSFIVEKIGVFNNRYYPVVSVIRDTMKSGYETRFELTEGEFDVEIDDSVFTIENLFK